MIINAINAKEIMNSTNTFFSIIHLDFQIDILLLPAFIDILLNKNVKSQALKAPEDQISSIILRILLLCHYGNKVSINVRFKHVVVVSAFVSIS